MTKDDIIRMAHSVAHPETEDPVNNGLITLTIDEMEHFVAIVAAAEREACASICFQEGPSIDGELIAEAIRARGEK